MSDMPDSDDKEEKKNTSSDKNPLNDPAKDSEGSVDDTQDTLESNNDEDLASAIRQAATLNVEARQQRGEEQFAGSDANEQEEFLWQINSQTIRAYVKQFPFLQVSQICSDDSLLQDKPLELLNAESGWIVHDYGNALASSRGEFMFGGGDYTIRLPGSPQVIDDVRDKAKVNLGKGTWINQAVDTAMELARIARQRKWEQVYIYDGDPIMQWAFWAEASYYGLSVLNYNPTEKAIEMRNRLKISKEQLDDIIAKRLDIGRAL